MFCKEVRILKLSRFKLLGLLLTDPRSVQGRTQGVGVKSPLTLDILQTLYYLRKGD